MNSLLSVGKLEGGFPPVESNGWNGETRQGGIKQSHETYVVTHEGIKV